eukprot:scaffold55487_cov19-Tisochrysis_lutea.AAC.1
MSDNLLAWKTPWFHVDRPEVGLAIRVNADCWGLPQCPLAVAQRSFPSLFSGFGTDAAFIKCAERRMPLLAASTKACSLFGWCGPSFFCIARLFAAMMEKAKILAYWEIPQENSLYKKGSVLDPGDYCTFAVNGTLYRLYANIHREHLQHAAQINRPDASPRLDPASIDF